MKKAFAKIVLFTIVSTLLSIINFSNLGLSAVTFEEFCQKEYGKSCEDFTKTNSNEGFCQSAYKMSCAEYEYTNRPRNDLTLEQFCQEKYGKSCEDFTKTNSNEGFCQSTYKMSCAEYEYKSRSTAEQISDEEKKEKYDKLLKILGTPLEDAKANPCIDIEGEDAGYIITYIEEPLVTQELDEDENYKSRICYRNTFSFYDPLDKKTIPITELSTECSRKGSDALHNTELKDLKITFSCQQIQVLLSKGGTSLIEGYIGTIYRYAASIVGVIAVLIIILSGIQISAAGGDTQAIENAKTRILKSIGGIVLLFLSALILYTINPTFFVK